jgi:Tfp pilus assembly protein PilV
MRNGPAHKRPETEGGFVMIEVLVSAMILVIATAGVAGLIATTVQTQADQRHGTEAYALAQEDQARLSAMQLPRLNHLEQTREVTLNQTVFKVLSKGLFVNNNISAQSCVEGNLSADYVQISSTVTWPGMEKGERTEIQSIVSPTTGSLDSSHGGVAVAVTSEQKAPMPGVEITSTGGSFYGVTDAAGCVVFPDLAKGNYPAIVSGEKAGLVNKDGKSSEEVAVAVPEGEVKPLARQFDHPGTIPVKFKTRIGSTASFTPAAADSIVAYNTNMTAAKVFWTKTAAREATVNVTPLFPFGSPYTLYAGSCSANNPNPGGESNPPSAAAIANLTAPAGGTATAPEIQLPALELIVKTGASAVAGAKVTITDKTCKEAKGVSLMKRVYTTNESGMPSSTVKGAAEQGLPWGVYEVCASANLGGTLKRKKVATVTVKTLTAATALTVDLANSTGLESGAECP